MSKKRNHSMAPVPPGNRPAGGPGGRPRADDEAEADNPTPGTGFPEEDPKRRLGDHTGAGEHAIQQPGGKNDADR